MRLRRDALTQLRAASLVLLLTLGVFLLWLVDPLPLQSLRLAQFDQFQRWYQRAGAVSPVLVIDIDEASLKAYGQWPWPRTRLAELVQRLHGAGTAVIVINMLLAEPDRTTPRAMARLWQNPEISAALQGLPDHDKVLAQALAGRQVVLGRSLLESAPDARPASAAQPQPYRIISSGAGAPAHWLHAFDSATEPLPILAATASGLGVMNFTSDSDSVVRRLPLFLRRGDQIVPSLSAEAVRVAQGARNYLLRSNSSGFLDARIGALTVPVNAQADMWLDFGRAPAVAFIPAAQVLGGKLAPDALRGRIVLVGSSAVGLMDMQSSPLGQHIPGVQVHAVALAQILSGVHLQRPGWTASVEALALVAGMLLVGLVTQRKSFKFSILVVALVLTLLLGGTWYAFTVEHLLLDAATPALAVLLSFLVAGGTHHFASEREHRWLRQAFSRYVSPNKVAYLMAHPEQLQLSGRRQVCSFVFTDLANFTTLIEHSDPAQMVTLINAYLEAMLEIVFRHEGTLDRIMGDALVVMFSAPVVQEDHRQRALDCALAMHVFASAYAERWQAKNVAWGHTRIGVHCGEVIVGNFGGKALFDYRALGDPINTAARLETVNKHLGTRVCISEAILEGCPGLPVRPVGRLVLKGKTQWLQTYEPVAATDARACAPLADYAAAMALLQAGHPALALAQFQTLSARHPKDPLVALHRRRLRDGATNDLIVLGTK
jgi:adenylate cyclase